MFTKLTHCCLAVIGFNVKCFDQWGMTIHKYLRALRVSSCGAWKKVSYKRTDIKQDKTNHQSPPQKTKTAKQYGPSKKDGWKKLRYTSLFGFPRQPGRKQFELLSRRRAFLMGTTRSALMFTHNIAAWLTAEGKISTKNRWTEHKRCRKPDAIHNGIESLWYCTWVIHI